MTSLILSCSLFLFTWEAAVSQSQATERPMAMSAQSVIALLESTDLDRKGEGLARINDSVTLQREPRVRAAVLRELSSMTQSRKEMKSGAGRGSHRQSELQLALIRTTARFDGPEVMTALLPHIGESAIAQRKVATYEDRAVEELLRRYRNGEGASEPELVRFGALKSLADITVRGRLSAEHRTAVEAAARQALQSEETFVFAGGMYLGAATHQPDLLQPVIRAQAGDFGARRLTENDARFLRGAGQRALQQAGISAR